MPLTQESETLTFNQTLNFAAAAGNWPGLTFASAVAVPSPWAGWRTMQTDAEQTDVVPIDAATIAVAAQQWGPNAALASDVEQSVARKFAALTTVVWLSVARSFAVCVSVFEQWVSMPAAAKFAGDCWCCALACWMRPGAPRVLSAEKSDGRYSPHEA